MSLDRSNIENRDVESFLSRARPRVRASADALRKVVRDAVPDVEEAVRPGWRLIGYRVPVQRGRGRYFCFCQPRQDLVHLGFEHGTLLDDPFEVLTGGGQQVRVVVVSSAAEARTRALRVLVEQAADLAREQGPGPR